MGPLGFPPLRMWKSAQHSFHTARGSRWVNNSLGTGVGVLTYICDRCGRYLKKKTGQVSKDGRRFHWGCYPVSPTTKLKITRYGELA